MIIPDFQYENKFDGFVVGIDEVGRGPLSGPVIAAALCFKTKKLPDSVLNLIDDSKKLTPLKRKKAYDELKKYSFFGIGAASVREIDCINILQATHLAMVRAFSHLSVRPNAVLVDGNKAPDFGIPTYTIVGGDAISLSIAAASIIAKVTRDHIMSLLDKRYPEYAWQKNAGYGTKEHQFAILTHGITKHHRLSFAPVRDVKEKFYIKKVA